MVSVKAGEVYSTEEKKVGVSSHGKYLMFPVKAEKGYDKFTVWANGVSKELEQADSARVKTILEVKISARKHNDKWISNYDVVAELEPVNVKNTDVVFDEFMDGPTEDDINKLFGL